MQRHKAVEHIRQILNLFREDMGDGMRPLQPTGHPQHAPCDDSAPELFVDVSPDDDIYDTGFILERQKDNPFGRAWALPQNDQPCYGHHGVLWWQHEVLCHKARWRPWPVGCFCPIMLRCDDLHENKYRTFMLNINHPP